MEEGRINVFCISRPTAASMHGRLRIPVRQVNLEVYRITVNVSVQQQLGH